jgi:hypothetical protein
MRALATVSVLIAALFFAALPAPSSAQVTIGFTIGAPPPMLPVYTQPPAPAPNYIFTPGYWAWGPAGYYWVPGTWVAPPQTGLLWTPGYWGYQNGGYAWNAGYWGPQVGFYGGIPYGYGYPGNGFIGGQWTPNGFSYNTAVWPVNTTVIHNTYVNRTVINRTVIVRRVSYNGGRGGIIMRPNAQQLAAARQRRVTMTPAQLQHVRVASQDRYLYASVNKGKPPIAAAARPFSPNHLPPKYKPITAADKAAAAKLVRKPPAAAKKPMAKPAAANKPMAKPAPAKKPAANKPPAVHKAPAMHKAPAYKAPPAHKAPAYHAGAMNKPAAKPAAKPAGAPVHHVAPAGQHPQPKGSAKPKGGKPPSH